MLGRLFGVVTLILKESPSGRGSLEIVSTGVWCIPGFGAGFVDYSKPHLFWRAREKRIFLVLLWGNPVQNHPKTQPLQVPFSLLDSRKSRSEVPERGDFGEENCLRKGGVDRAKKGQKGCTKEGGKLQRTKEKNLERTLLFSAPNPGVQQTLVQKRSEDCF